MYEATVMSNVTVTIFFCILGRYLVAEPDVENKYSTFNLYAVSIYIGNITTVVKRIYQ